MPIHIKFHENNVLKKCSKEQTFDIFTKQSAIQKYVSEIKTVALFRRDRKERREEGRVDSPYAREGREEDERVDSHSAEKEQPGDTESW